MRRILQLVCAVVLTVGSTQGLHAQAPAAETAVQRAVVQELFDAMRAGDSARIRAVFHPQMQYLMTSEIGPDGKARLSATPLDAFIRAVGVKRAEPIDERIFNPRVMVDGPLASVWVDYSVYLGTKFMHCGVDVFHIAQVGDTWKIAALTDTRRLTGCTR